MHVVAEHLSNALNVRVSSITLLYLLGTTCQSRERSEMPTYIYFSAVLINLSQKFCATVSQFQRAYIKAFIGTETKYTHITKEACTGHGI